MRWCKETREDREAVESGKHWWRTSCILSAATPWGCCRDLHGSDALPGNNIRGRAGELSGVTPFLYTLRKLFRNSVKDFKLWLGAGIAGVLNINIIIWDVKHSVTTEIKPKNNKTTSSFFTVWWQLIDNQWQGVTKCCFILRNRKDWLID